jgi:tetratricopeptide (TPR) repeat protein
MENHDMKKLSSVYVVLFLLIQPMIVLAADTGSIVKDMQNRWAVANYELSGKSQLEAFEALLLDVEKYRAQYSDSAEVLIWSGIIKSTFAGVKGGLGALKYAKQSKADLEKAMEINSVALDGSAYTSLGTLYFRVPGWPIGFGDNDKAEKLLHKALEINPNGIDANYFYGDYLREKGDYSGAQRYLVKALKAPARPGRQLADSGRKKEIHAALTEVGQHLK